MHRRPGGLRKTGGIRLNKQTAGPSERKQPPKVMRFAIPFILSAVALGALACFLGNLTPIELPPGMAEKHKTSELLSAK